MTLHHRVVDAVWLRDQARCFICAVPLIRGSGGYSIHHRRPRGMGGSSDPVTDSVVNLILVCGSGTTGCHGRLESQRSRAFLNGWLVSRSSDPRELPVLRWRSSMVWLYDDGTLGPAHPSGRHTPTQPPTTSSGAPTTPSVDEPQPTRSKEDK